MLVTFREEGVDWNFYVWAVKCTGNVTFREEGVDWNIGDFDYLLSLVNVTFREEGVDWNPLPLYDVKRKWKSPSARKVWIEINFHQVRGTFVPVTFREEGVDWNKSIFS